MKKTPLLKSTMTPFPYAVDIEAPLLSARKMMLEHSVHHLPVTENRDLKGIISDRDIKLLLGPEFDYPNPKELTVRDAFVEDCFVVDINTMLRDVLATMADRHIGAALVTKNDHLAGIFTVTDACRAFAEFLTPDAVPDESA
jgi:CBS domain-containing protein